MYRTSDKGLQCITHTHIQQTRTHAHARARTRSRAHTHALTHTHTYTIYYGPMYIGSYFELFVCLKNQ